MVCILIAGLNTYSEHRARFSAVVTRVVRTADVCRLFRASTIASINFHNGRLTEQYPLQRAAAGSRHRLLCLQEHP